MALRYAILGLLIIFPMSGYEIKKFFESSIKYFWNAGYGQIYPELNKLVEENLIEKTVIYQKNKPNKNVHRITKKGTSMFIEWLEKPVKLRFMKDEFLLKFYFFDKLNSTIILEHLKRHKKLSEDRLNILKAVFNYAKDISDFQLFSVENGIMHFEADIKWLNKVISYVEKKK